MTEARYAAACRRIPGGVNSPVRAFGAVGGAPVFFARGAGARLYDADGREYLDYVGAWGPMIAGHAHPEVLRRVRETVDRGLCFGAPHELETELAEQLCARMPALEKVRMVSSGTEAAMSALRLARAATGRDRILKFAGCYHGHADALLAEAGSGALTCGVPASPGVPAGAAADTEVARYNDPADLEARFAARGPEFAAAIVEPVAGNMGCVLPEPGFLETLRALCARHGALLIFDEVMTGFRVGPGGAQERFGLRPDLTVLGKAIGGGMPVGAFGGRAELMDRLAPAGPVYQAGTLSGHPVAMAAGLATLAVLDAPGFYPRLRERAAQLVAGLRARAAAAGIGFEAVEATGMFGLFFTGRGPVRNDEDARACDIGAWRAFFRGMLAAGVYLAPSPYEAGFLSGAHEAADIERTLAAAEAAFAAVQRACRA